MKKSATDPNVVNLPDYRHFIEDLKARVVAARTSAARAVNTDLIVLYWDIGQGIVEKQQTLGWGDSVVEMVASDLQRAFPGMKGFSPRNVWYMRRLYETYSEPTFLAQSGRETDQRGAHAILPQPVAELDAGLKRPQVAAKISRSQPFSFLPQLVAEIPWGHHRLILDKLAEPAARLFYLRATAQFGWSRNVLLNQIKAGAYERAVTETKTHKLPATLKGKLPTAKQLSDVVRTVLPERNAPR